MSKENYDIKALSELKLQEIKSKKIALKKELFNLRFQKTLGELKNTSRFNEVKKNIARLNTEITKRNKEI